MDRREFVKFLALLAAGATAAPEQIEAFRHYYNMNTPNTAAPLVAVDEVFISGMADRALPVTFDILLRGPPEQIKLALGLNAFGGCVRWCAMGDQKIVAADTDFMWRLARADGGDRLEPKNFHGHISYVDQDGIRGIRVLDTVEGGI